MDAPYGVINEPEPLITKWYWYLITAFVPVVGIITGIIAAAKHHVGPALAMWMTAYISILLWIVFIAALAGALASNSNTGYTY